MPVTFLTQRVSLLICGGLFLVGGWGLGRDVGFEASLRRERARSARLAYEAEQAQLLALRAHLDPHFLFNTLNAIAEWCRQDGAVAEKAVLQLSDLLRALLRGARVQSWPLSEELGLVRALFDLHRLRDPSAFELDWQVATAVESVPVPPLLLLPLAENAVKHGPAAGHPGTLGLRCEQAGDRLKVTVQNPGAYAGPRDGSSGVPTMERRLALAYGGAARFEIHREGERTVATIEMPLQGPSAGA
jgi:LytS/YehU family sensor histidine kinase